MNSAEKQHWNANSSVSSILRRSPVFRISKPFLSRFITASSRSFHFHARVLRSRRIQPVQTSGKYCRDRPPEEQRLFHQKRYCWRIPHAATGPAISLANGERLVVA